MVDAINWSLNGSVNSSSSQLEWTVGYNANVDIVDWVSSHEAIVDNFVHAHASRNRHQERHSQFSRAINRNDRSHPYDRVSMVGEGEFHVFARTFDVGKVDIIPACGVSSHLSALVPIEVDKVLAQARVGSSVLHVETKCDSLIRSDHEIHICSIHAIVETLKTNHFLYEATYYVRSSKSEIHC